MRPGGPEIGMRSRAVNTVVAGIVCFVVGCSNGLAADGTARASTALTAFLARKVVLDAISAQYAGTAALRDRVFASGFEPADAQCGIDSDGDGLPDCVETATGVFVDLGDTGTDPFNADTDGDHLSDGDELLGTAAGLDLPALGVNPLRRDLLVEYDWFDDDRECELHSHAPSMAALQRIAAVFAEAPLLNPDGSRGIHLVQDVGQGGALTGGNRIDDFDPVLPGALDEHYRAIRDAHFAAERRGVFRYVLLPHRYNGNSPSSGYAELPGDDAIVTLYCLGNDDNLVRAVIHELGHLLGLHHGGFEACNGKPNYSSTMNYRYQFNGLDSTCTATGDRSSEGFSDGARLPLDEAALDEHAGVCGSPAIDWNNDGVLEAALARDLNPTHAEACGASLQVLHDFDDWANVGFVGIRDGGLLKSLQQEVACIGVAPR